MTSITVLLTETALAYEFVASFRNRRLPEKFFYWFPLSVRAWLDLCSDGDYRNYVRSRSLIAQTANEVAALVGPGPLEVVSLGCGQGDKDRLLLDALRAAGADVRYVAVDSSQALLELACAEATTGGIAASGIKADFTHPGHLAAVAGSEGPRRLVMVIGNTLGAADPLAFARDLRSLLRPGDLVLVDGEIYGGAVTLAGYDNSINRRFAWAPLRAVGIGSDDGALVFEEAADPRLPGLHLVPKHFLAERDATALMGGELLTLRAGERLEMNHSYKYSPAAFDHVLGDAGLGIRWSGTSDDGRLRMVVAGPD